MNKEQYKNATPVIQEIELLECILLPNVQPDNQTKRITVIGRTDRNTMDVSICFTRNQCGDYNPVFGNSRKTIALTESEYNKIKDVINNSLQNRIREKDEKLNKI